MITATSTTGIRRRVILNESILLVDSHDKLSFDVVDNQANLKLNFHFVFLDVGKELTANVDVNDKDITFNLHRWDDNLPIENTSPYELSIVNSGEKIWCKFNTYSKKEFSQRFFSLTIWIEEK